MLTIGLTGGIGSGKSTVAQMFADLGVPIVDTDEIARQLTEPGQAILEEIHQHFGDTVFNSDKSLNRTALATHVFNDHKARQQLEAILHPAIWQEVDTQLQTLSAGYCILVVPLLIETQQTARVDRVLVVDTSETVQVNRTQQRDQRSEADIRSIMQAQVNRETRLSAADDVIDNNDNSGLSLTSQVSALHQKYLSLVK